MGFLNHGNESTGRGEAVSVWTVGRDPPPHAPGADRDSLIGFGLGYMTMFVWDKTRGLESEWERVMAKGPRRDATIS